MKPYTRLQRAMLIALCPGPTAAGLYSPDETPPFEAKEGAEADALPFATFRILMADLTSIGMPASRLGMELTARVDRRIGKDPAELSPADLAGLTYDLIRLGRVEQAFNILQKLTRNPRQAGFLPLTHLARIHQGRGEWPEAYEHEYSALRDYPFPESFPNHTKAQLEWFHRVERDYYLPFLRHRPEEARQQKVMVSEPVDPLFPAPRKGEAPASRQPVEYVGESGHYEAGTIAAAQRAKLPPDALAIVQQVVLWAPEDSRLYWQLGELYNAQGDLEAAAEVFAI